MADMTENAKMRTEKWTSRSFLMQTKLDAREKCAIVMISKFEWCTSFEMFENILTSQKGSAHCESIAYQVNVLSLILHENIKTAEFISNLNGQWDPPSITWLLLWGLRSFFKNGGLAINTTPTCKGDKSECKVGGKVVQNRSYESLP